MSRGKKGGPAHKAAPQQQGELQGGGIESVFAQSFGPMLARLQSEALEAAKKELRAEFGAAKPALVPPEPAGVGSRGPLRGPNSRYSEPGVRSRKRLADQGEEAKVWSGFMDRDLVDRFKAKCKKYGVTQRRAMEWAMNYWVEMPGVGEREVKWKS